MVTLLHGILRQLRGFMTVGDAMTILMVGIATRITIAIHLNSNTGSGCKKNNLLGLESNFTKVSPRTRIQTIYINLLIAKTEMMSLKPIAVKNYELTHH